MTYRHKKYRQSFLIKRLWKAHRWHQAKQAQAKEKPYKLSDEKGLYLYITKKAQKYWRFDYRFGDKRKTLAMGVYPGVTLADARAKRDNGTTLPIALLAHG